MGYELALIDNWWDTRIGREKMEELAQYAATKGVGISLWYNSNGFWSDAPQGPKNRMNTAVARKKEMAWLQRIGVKGIKVDFFGGDKQETITLRESCRMPTIKDWQLIFHGCTSPAAGKRLYPNFAGSESVLASENLIFTSTQTIRKPTTPHCFPLSGTALPAWISGRAAEQKGQPQQRWRIHPAAPPEIFQQARSLVPDTGTNFGITRQSAGISFVCDRFYAECTHLMG